ncbi:MAG TPA: cobalamin-dependent protein, partial [Soehngenia sp.]|nr:cobalamin-dependent protein [Soehngenia sp.]
ERDNIGINHDENIIVLCPKFEEHEIGARMAADFFTIVGFKTTYIGANTPEDTLSLAVEKLKPKYISMSVTNYYNLIEAKRAIDRLRQKDNYSGEIILGGYAFVSDPQVYKRIGGDYLLSNFNEILKFSKGENL